MDLQTDIGKVHVTHKFELFFILYKVDLCMVSIICIMVWHFVHPENWLLWIG